MTGPLNKVRILDLTHVWAGPLAVRFLSDLGAEVVKVEAPYGRGPKEFPHTPLGGWIGGTGGDEPWNANAIFVKLHRNRKSLCIDLKAAIGREMFLELVKVADVVIENFSARAMPAMNLDYEVLRAANPNIIYVAMPGFGTSGPYRDRVAFGPTVEPLSGLTTMLGYGPDEPRNSAIALMDPVCATNAAAAVTAALRQRENEGCGNRVEMSLHEGGVSYSGPWLLDQQLGRAPGCIGNNHPQMSPHGIYPCLGDDEWIAVACVNDHQWQHLADIIDYPPGNFDLASRVERKDEIGQAISRWTRQHAKSRAAEILQDRGVPAGAVNTTPDMMDDPHIAAREFFVPYERFDTPIPGNACHMAGVTPGTWTSCPRLGADNREVLSSWLSLSEDKISELAADHVIFDSPPA